MCAIWSAELRTIVCDMLSMMRTAVLICAIGFASCGTSGSDGNDAGASVEMGAGADAAGAGANDLASDLSSALPATALVYVSGYSTTIGRYQLDEATGALTAMGTTTATGSPSFLAFDVARRRRVRDR